MFPFKRGVRVRERFADSMLLAFKMEGKKEANKADSLWEYEEPKTQIFFLRPSEKTVTLPTY